MSLEEIRSRIDALDMEIVALLEKRAEAGMRAAEEKRRLGQPLRNPVREREVLDRLAAGAHGPLSGERLENIYRAIMAETLAAEEEEVPCRGHDVDGVKRDFAAEVVENAEVGPGFCRMRLRAVGIGSIFLPGQFFQMRIDVAGGAQFLRRPFAPAEADGDGMAFYYAVVGEGTRHMSRVRPGHRVSILAPLGNAYTPLPAGASALLVGGGCGGPSLTPLARSLREAGVKTVTLLGARTACGLLGHESLGSHSDHIVLATDDGSAGYRGTTIDAYHEKARDLAPRMDRIYACGPLPMLKAVADLAMEVGVDCEVSLEERMACGFGACMGCAVPVLNAGAGDDFTYRRVCHEGPVFNSRALAWPAMRA